MTSSQNLLRLFLLLSYAISSLLLYTIHTLRTSIQYARQSLRYHPHPRGYRIPASLSGHNNGMLF